LGTTAGCWAGRLALPSRTRRGVRGLDSTAGDTTFARYTNLSPGSHYLFLVLALDEAGALTPTLSLDENVLQVAVDLAASLGPLIHVFNSFLDFTYQGGGYTVDELRWIRLEAPADRPITFNWEAFASAGATIERYRWGVDLTSVADETPRVDEVNDYFHWSRGGPLEQSCTLVGLPPACTSSTSRPRTTTASRALASWRSSSWCRRSPRSCSWWTTPAASWTGSRAGGSTRTWTSGRAPPSWTRFLYARGGVPWRATQDPASGVTSVPGVFAGYAFDTLGTRLGLEIPSNGVTLETLGHYRQVVWLVDRRGAATAGTDAIPLTVLRYTSDRGRASALSAYVQAGGRVWLMGGGAGTASIVAFDDAKNNTTSAPVYSNDAGELVPGRLMYDAVHWQSAFATTNAQATLLRSPRAEEIAADPWSHPDHWTGGEVHAPDYRRLPEQIRPLDPAVDPVPPTRFQRQRGLYYQSVFTCEYLTVPNVITEDVDPSDTDVRIASTLDTLLEASSFLLLRSPAPIMTWYHGADANRIVFTGFAPWLFNRSDFIALTDFVLHDIWGLQREPVDRGDLPGRPGGRGRRRTGWSGPGEPPACGSGTSEAGAISPVAGDRRRR
jgi:hypothetical protein